VELVRNETGLLEAQCDAPEWLQGDRLLRHLKEHFTARVIDKTEGPDARTWSLEIRGERIVVNQWDTGDISLSAKSVTGEGLIEMLADDVRRQVG
jgi:hypothetical protein